MNPGLTCLSNKVSSVTLCGSDHLREAIDHPVPCRLIVEVQRPRLFLVRLEIQGVPLTQPLAEIDLQ